MIVPATNRHRIFVPRINNEAYESKSLRTLRLQILNEGLQHFTLIKRLIYAFLIGSLLLNQPQK